MNGAERRRSPRYSIAGVEGVFEGHHRCELLKISRIGMLATTEYEPALDATLHVDLWLPGARVRTAGRVAFVGPDTHDPERRWHRVGIEFTAMGNRSRRALEEFIAAEVAAGRAQLSA